VLHAAARRADAALGLLALVAVALEALAVLVLVHLLFLNTTHDGLDCQHTSMGSRARLGQTVGRLALGNTPNGAPLHSAR
jgi:hypothetical protein